MWTDALEWLSAWQTLRPYWMTNRTSNPTIWQALQLSLPASRLTSLASGWEKKPLMAYFNEPLSNICTAAWNRNTQGSTAHVTFQKLSTLLFLFVSALRPRLQWFFCVPSWCLLLPNLSHSHKAQGYIFVLPKHCQVFFKRLCSGNLREWVYHRRGSPCKCVFLVQ